MTRVANAIALAALLAAVPAVMRAQTPGAATATPSRVDYTRTLPLKARIVAADGKDRVLTFAGRTLQELIFSDSTSPQLKKLNVESVQDAYFEMEYDRIEVMRAVRNRDWDKAVSLILPTIKPTLMYLDLPGNNAAQLVLDAGDYMMRAAEQKLGIAETDADEEAAMEKYKSAYSVLTYAGKAFWYSGGLVAKLKSYQCLLAMDKPKTARHYLADVDEPMVGDAAYGLFWLLTGELDAQKGDWPGAMQAAVKSLCFEDKNVDTFPDALLLSARCYEELQQWHRARDVYYEVARIFPQTDWSETAVRRLRFVVDKGLTEEEEAMPIENVFFQFQEDMNEKVATFLEELDKAAPQEYEYDESYRSKQYEEDDFDEDGELKNEADE